MLMCVSLVARLDLNKLFDFLIKFIRRGVYNLNATLL